MKKIYIIKEDFIGLRLDKWLKKNIFDIPQSLIEKNIRKGKIKVNNKKEKSSYKLNKEDKIYIYDFNPTIKKRKINNKYQASKKEIHRTSQFIINNNENFIVINKPSGIAVQSGTKSRRNILDILSKTKYFENSSPYSVHRIDKETTGALIIAKNREYAQLITSLFRLRKIYKTYLGIALGEFKEKKGTFVDILYTYENGKKVGTKALSRFEVLDTNNKYTFLKLNPITGRKHQLRKQLLLHNHPILGDTKYKIINNYRNKKNQLMLHAYKIKFSINDKNYEFVAEPTETFKKTLKEKYLKSFF